MAWVTPVDFTTGCLITAASWNQNVHANTKYLKGQAGTVTIEDRLDNQSQTLLIGVLRSSCATAGDFLSRLDLESGSAGAPANAFSRYGGIYTQTTTNGSPVIWGLTTASGIGIGFAINGACKVLIDTGGAVLIGDNTNANVTIGLTINQGVAGDEIFSLKSACVTHGFTNETETDTYAFMKKPGASGGVILEGLTSEKVGIFIRGGGVTDVTSRSTVSEAYTEIVAYKKSGNSAGTPGANANLLAIVSGGDVEFLFDADGDFHANAAVTASSYDRFDDVAAVRALELHRSPAVIARDAFDEWVNYSRRDLEAMKIATFNDQPGGDGSVFINYTALARLHSGAIWQMHKRLAELEALVKPKGPTLLARAQLWIGVRVRRWRFRRRGESSGWFRRLRQIVTGRAE